MKQPNYTFNDYLKAAMLQYLKDGNYKLVKWKRKPGGKIKIEIQDHLAKNEKQGGFINGIFGIFERKRNGDSNINRDDLRLRAIEDEKPRSIEKSTSNEDSETRKENAKEIKPSEEGSNQT